MSAKNIYTVQELVELDIIEKPLDGNHGSIHPTSKDYVLDGIPFIMASDLSNGLVDFSSCKFITEEQANTLRKGFSKTGDILLSHKATIGRTAIVQENKYSFLVLTPQVTYYRVKNKNKLNNLYLKYYFDSHYFQSILQQWAGSGSTRAYIGITEQLKLPIVLPSIDIQNEIVSIISRLDQKIQLNTQINQTLEQITQAIFKSWFVDFDPVRAKATALESGKTQDEAELAAMQAISVKTAEELAQMPFESYAELAEIAKAFPSEFGEDGVPMGWEVKPLPEFIDFLEGPGIRNWQYTDAEDGIKFINIRCIQNGDLTLSTANKITKEEAFGKYKHFQLEEDDIVVSTSGTLGRFAFVRKEHLPLSLNTSVIRFRPIENKSTLAFIAGFVENQLQYELEIRASGSAQRNFGPMHLKQIYLSVPNFNLLELHQKYVSSLFKKRKQLLSEIDVLKNTRDLLLPRLLNGEM